MKSKSKSLIVFVCIQVCFVSTLIAAWLSTPDDIATRFNEQVKGKTLSTPLEIPREKPLNVTPLYDDPQVVSDEELAMVLKKLQPRFDTNQLKPNFVEHALRTWGIDAEFSDPKAMSGEQMKSVLLDHAKFIRSWGGDIPPLLEDSNTGVSIRYDRKPGGSVHHDHLLASLTEAGIALDEPVFGPGRVGHTFNDVLQQAIRDFRLDERETEWSAMAFGFWLAPQRSWVTGEGRRVSFDDLGRRLIRSHKRFGVCSGTHRVYSIMVLLRLHDEFDLLSEPVRQELYSHLENVRDLIIASQYEDGHWSPDWSYGKEAKPLEFSYKDVIATGHHLEWLSIAPEELHPPRDSIYRAADWVIEKTRDLSEDELKTQYTFYSHIASALAMWRKSAPYPWWQQHNN